MKEDILEQFPILVMRGPKLLMALLLLAIFGSPRGWFAGDLCRRDQGGFRISGGAVDGDGGTVTLLVAGIVTALGTVGVDVSALVAGLGLTGFALGFAIGTQSPIFSRACCCWCTGRFPRPIMWR